VQRQRHERELNTALTASFAALVDVVAEGRWGGTVVTPGSAPPRAGCCYEQRRGTLLRRGKVLACLRPVSMTVQETLLDPPYCVRLRLHWRLEPIEDGSFVRLEARFSLVGVAVLRRRHWHERIAEHCTRLLDTLERHILFSQET
jgi:hypothetical protein